jgi:hypothetical protein
MKSVIVFYVPIRYGDTDAVYKKNDKIIDKNLEEMKKTQLHNDFHIVVIQDPNIDVVHTEVFFKPE